MRKKVLMTLGITTLALTILFVMYHVFAAMGTQVSQTQVSMGKLAEGEIDPNTYSYRLCGSWECTETNGAGKNPANGTYQIYCTEHGTSAGIEGPWITVAEALSANGKTYTRKCSHIADSSLNYYGPYSDSAMGESYTFKLSNTYYEQVSTSKLSPEMAYIVSNVPISKYSDEKQNAIWNILANEGGNCEAGAPTSLDPEAKDYAQYEKAVKEKGLSPEDKTNLDDIKVKVDQDGKEYTVGPFNLNYASGSYGDIAFAGISNMVIYGYNKNGDLTRDDIKVEKIIRKNSATGSLEQPEVPEYFEADETLKVDKTKQVYPAPGQDFEIVFEDPNANLSADDPNRIVSIALKVNFQYMLASGEKVDFNGFKYKVNYKDQHTYDHTHGSIVTKHCFTCLRTSYISKQDRQDAMCADAIRTLYEQEILLGRPNIEDEPEEPNKPVIPDNPEEPDEPDVPEIVLTMDLGGFVWEDALEGKESLADGRRTEADIPLKNVKVTLYTQDGELAELLSTVDEEDDDIMHVVNPTYTDENGFYKFRGLDSMQKYYVVFEYNGQTYLPTEYLKTGSNQFSSVNEMVNAELYNTEDWNVTSKGTEKQEERDQYDQKFASIGSYPENYATSNSLGVVGSYNATFSQRDLMGYTLDANGNYKQTETQLVDGYLYDEQGLKTEEYKDGEISNKVREYIKQNEEFPDEEAMKSIYSQIAGNNEEMLKKLQFIEDCKINSYTKPQDGEYDLYPVYDNFIINSKQEDSDEYDMEIQTIDGVDYYPIYPGQFYVNQGLWRRPEPDIALRKDVYKATLKINGRTEIYDYDERDLLTDEEKNKLKEIETAYGRDSSEYTNYQNELELNDRFWEIRSRVANYDYYYGENYERPLYPAEKNYDGQNSLEAYVTYKITVRNQSQSILTQIDEVVDYFDSTYTFEPSLSWVMYRSNTESNEDVKVTPDEFYNIMTGNGNSVGSGKYKNVQSSETGKYSENTRFNLGSEYNNIYINGLSDHKFKTGETGYIYLTFKVNGQGTSLSIENNNTDPGKQNIAEINGYTTYYADETSLPNNVAKNSSNYAGLLDRDSNPGNFTQEKLNDKEQGRYEHHFEDDTDRARGITVYVDNNLIRMVSGTTWEDKRTYGPAGTEALIGNGVKEDGEKKIEGITVALYEVIDGKTSNEVAKVYNETSGTWENAVTTTNGDGYYAIDGFIPGDYVVRFIYSGQAYNGQDYKSTTYQYSHASGSGIDQNGRTDISKEETPGYYGYTNVNDAKQNESAGYGYSIYKADEFGQNLSDAKDIWSRRQVVNEYSSQNGNGVTNKRAEELANITSEEAVNNTAMVAETGVIRMEVEYNREQSVGDNNQSNNGIHLSANKDIQNYKGENDKNGGYHLANVDFGLEERPKAGLELNKQVSHILVTLANKTVLFDTTKTAQDLVWKSKMPYNINEMKEITKYDDHGPKVNKESSKNVYSDYTRYDDFRKAVLDRITDRVTGDRGIIQAIMDEEIMHGANLQITYNMTVKNIGEVDYNETSFYYTGNVQNKDSIVKTSADIVMDYVTDNLKYSAENNKNNGTWAVVTEEQINSNNYVNSNVAKELKNYSTILATNSLRKDLVPATTGAAQADTQTSNNLVLTQTLSTQSKDDDFSYNNVAEIIQISNTVGRRMAYSIQGNQSPSQNPTEPDASVAEEVKVLPPFGQNYLYIGLVISVIAMLGVGIVVIKKVMKF